MNLRDLKRQMRAEIEASTSVSDSVECARGMSDSQLMLAARAIKNIQTHDIRLVFIKKDGTERVVERASRKPCYLEKHTKGGERRPYCQLVYFDVNKGAMGSCSWGRIKEIDVIYE